jgi:pentapeptide MXKDX repeat protein
MLSEAFAVSQSDCYPIAKRVQQIVVSFIVLVAYPKAFDLVGQVIARFALVDCGLVEGVVGVFDALLVNVARNREGSFVLAHAALIVSLGAVSAPAAFAQDKMTKDTMSKDAMKKDDAMAHDAMKKDDAMAHDTMKKDDAMGHDAMKNDDAMAHAAMKKDEMKK